MPEAELEVLTEEQVMLRYTCAKREALAIMRQAGLFYVGKRKARVRKDALERWEEATATASAGKPESRSARIRSLAQRGVDEFPRPLGKAASIAHAPVVPITKPRRGHRT